MTDMLLARGEVDGFNLAIGEPTIIHDAWLKESGHQYPPAAGLPKMVAAAERYTEGMYGIKGTAVIANGAKQALLAAFYAYRKRGMAFVSHQAPYWPSYPTLAKLAGLKFSTQRGSGYVECLTSPNNPDGAISTAACHIWDAVYASRMYGWDGQVPDCEVVVNSASKQFGAPGWRLGWLVAKDPQFAKDAAEYVELTTSGVSTLSQAQYLYLNNSTLWARESIRNAFFANYEAFNAYLGSLVTAVSGVPYDGVGMFAWFKAGNPQRFAKALSKARVLLVPGSACGMRETGWWRMNMAADLKLTENALTALRKAYDEER